jgi:hypothetical protein
VRSRAEQALVRVDEADEPDLATIGDVERLVLLTGADDAAVVACYRKLKSLAAGANDGRPLPVTQLTVVGASLARGRLAHDRIARAARAFLEADLLEPIVVERIAPTRSQVLYSGPTSLTAETLVRGLRSAEPTAPSAPPAAAPDPVPEVSSAPQEQSQPMPEGQPATPAPQADLGQQKQRTSPVRANPYDSLAALVPGLLPLETRCPVAPGVTFAYDATGSLHLLAGSIRPLPQLSTPTPLRCLLRANAWARSHAALLARLESRLVENAAEHAEMHLVTDRPAEAQAVVDTPIRTHIVVPATPAPLGMVTVSLDH